MSIVPKVLMKFQQSVLSESDQITLNLRLSTESAITLNALRWKDSLRNLLPVPTEQQRYRTFHNSAKHPVLLSRLKLIAY